MINSKEIENLLKNCLEKLYDKKSGIILSFYIKSYDCTIRTENTYISDRETLESDSKNCMIHSVGAIGGNLKLIIVKDGLFYSIDYDFVDDLANHIEKQYILKFRCIIEEPNQSISIYHGKLEISQDLWDKMKNKNNERLFEHNFDERVL